jgi:hypothetical protein
MEYWLTRCNEMSRCLLTHFCPCALPLAHTNLPGLRSTPPPPHTHTKPPPTSKALTHPPQGYERVLLPVHPAACRHQLVPELSSQVVTIAVGLACVPDVSAERQLHTTHRRNMHDTAAFVMGSTGGSGSHIVNCKRTRKCSKHRKHW